jgi:hypothetical protein
LQVGESDHYDRPNERKLAKGLSWSNSSQKALLFHRQASELEPEIDGYRSRPRVTNLNMDASLWARHPTKHYTNGSNSPTVYFDEEWSAIDSKAAHET